jgi:hypothetical protein
VVDGLAEATALAAALFIGPETAGVHVSRILAELGVGAPHRLLRPAPAVGPASTLNRRPS